MGACTSAEKASGTAPIAAPPAYTAPIAAPPAYTAPPPYTEAAVLDHAKPSPDYAVPQTTEEEFKDEDIKTQIIAALDVSGSMDEGSEVEVMPDPLNGNKPLVCNKGPKRIEVARKHLFDLILWASKTRKLKPILFTFGSEVNEIVLPDDLYNNLDNPKAQSQLETLLNAIKPGGCTNLISLLINIINIISRTWYTDKNIRFYAPIFTDGTPYLGKNAIPQGFTNQEYIEMEKMRILNLMAEFASNTMSNELKDMKDSSVAFQFIQIGKDPSASEFLTILDDYLGLEQQAPPFEAFMMVDGQKVKRRMEFQAKFDIIDTITPEMLQRYVDRGLGDRVWDIMFKHAYTD
jgi:hypothetical protein